jgi:para-aminobenzoate synthetase component 1
MQEFMKKAQYWASSFSTLCIFDSNGFDDLYSAFSMMIAVGKEDSFEDDGLQTWENLQRFINLHQGKFITGYLGYDLEYNMDKQPPINNLKAKNNHAFPNSFFFVPETQLIFRDREVEIISKDPSDTLNLILKSEYRIKEHSFRGEIKNRMSREEYSIAFQKIQKHILQGDIYEVNLCQEFYSENAYLLPFEAYKQLNKLSPSPFSCFLKNNDQYIISASPERFLARRGTKLISQPIKGTTSRGKTPIEDQLNKEHLSNNPKDIQENIMIVDLVRNDLTRSAEKGTVKVEELLGLYSFPHVHQLISTISCEQANGIEISEIIANTFPPGSMTGAPKLSAIQISEQTEKSKRGIYSGSVGYIAPSGDFDFNVVIRSMIYNESKSYLSYHVGGAITALSIEDDEYQECLLKAKAITKLLKGNIDTASLN